MLLCKNVVVNGRRTSMRLEREVWNALSESCRHQNISLNSLCSQIEKSKDKIGLSSAMRVYAFNYYRQLQEDYRKA
ncbi:MAG: ribbon-helix-helix domain-containing protein [Alphaproteobacteria bacterium]|nr:ribbon-helix-helix domain-containing protein [Alphaproteobacteria bacterium]